MLQTPRARATRISGHEMTQGARDAAPTRRPWRPPRAAIAAHPDKPDGHFWLAANMGVDARYLIAAASSSAATSATQLEKVLTLDKGFQEGSGGSRARRWYFQVPGLFGGSKRKSRKSICGPALAYNPLSIVTRSRLLAETLKGPILGGTRAIAESRREYREPGARPRTGSRKTPSSRHRRATLARLTGLKHNVPAEGAFMPVAIMAELWFGPTPVLQACVTCLSFAVHGQSDSA